MKPVRVFTILPKLPPWLERLRPLAHNLKWCWDPEIIGLFRRLDPDLWESTGHNPVLLLGNIAQEKLEEAGGDDGFLAQFGRVVEKFDRYMTHGATWYRRTHRDMDKCLVAYFSAEFGLTDCIPIYSGGLAILAGDHLKSASDLGIPLVGVGLLYQKGYFRQYLNADGWQQESYPTNDFYNMPVQPARTQDGSPVTIEVALPGRTVVAQVWRAQVGRVQLVLLDSNVPENRAADQNITDELYGGDMETRIQQEILLGIGGVRAVNALRLRPTVWHMNEGHSAFLALERIRLLMQDSGLSFYEAREFAEAGNLFTTHTPVPAGIDRFPPDLFRKYFADYCSGLGLSCDELLALGRDNPQDTSQPLCMATLALRLTAYTNGVSKLHGRVSRRMWQVLWPMVPEAEVPVSSVTNGVHLPSWISHDMSSLFDRYLGPRWIEDPAHLDIWERVGEIPDEELWRTHERRRERLVAFVRRRLCEQLRNRGASDAEVNTAGEALNPEVLTLVFARRFATYKRATLLLHDQERLLRLLANKERPVQVIFAGKAHPKDNGGKELIREVVHFSRREEARGRLVFIEDYDMSISRYLTQGADLWLNTPRRLMEASGTSGMKAAANGAIQLSILDGWWHEAYTPGIGWAIGREEQYDDPALQDNVEANALYRLMEDDIVPLFYERGRDGLPRGWIARMKASMSAICAYFNTTRMVLEYTERFYVPCALRAGDLAQEGLTRAKALAQWKAKVRQAWPKVQVVGVDAGAVQEVKVGDEVRVRATVRLGGDLTPDDVSVQVYYGSLDASGVISEGKAVAMTCEGPSSAGPYSFVAAIPCVASGRHGYSVRVLPNHPDLVNSHEMGLITWANA